MSFSPNPVDSASSSPDSGSILSVMAGLLAGLAGLALVMIAVLMPAGMRAVDPAVLAAAGEGTETLEDAEFLWLEAGKPGTAALFGKARERFTRDEDVLQIFPIMVDPDPFLELWGGPDPLLEQVFAEFSPSADQSDPAVMPLFLSRQARQKLGRFLENSKHPGVQAVLENREVESAETWMPVRSASGQPLEATIYLTALLLQGDHLSQTFASEIRRLAEEANAENHLGEIGAVYLDWLAIGSRLQWQALTEFASRLEGGQELKYAAHLAQVLEEDWPVYAAAAIWSNQGGELAEWLMAEGREGLDDLKQAMALGRGALDWLLEQKKPIAKPGWRERLEAPVLLPEVAARFPLASTVFKLGFLLSGLCLFFAALNLILKPTKTPENGFGGSRLFSFFQSLLLASVAGVALLFFAEPLLLEEGRMSEFRLSFPISVATGEAQLSTDEGVRMKMDQITLLSVGGFFLLQMILYIICWIKVLEIRRQPVASQVKLQLLENEEQLFDSGLYVGLSGTVGALICLALGIVEPSLMAAYSSTLFGVIFVAFFKICHLRPYRRRLIIESHPAAAW